MGMADYWYMNAVIYAVDVGAFMDADGDGRGDFSGLISRLDYIADLGVNCVWLLPFYPSPFRDNGYDVTDHYGVEPDFGTPGDFVEFRREAAARGLRVLIDLVGNHTSVDHPWFQIARRDRRSHYRNYYVWADEKPEPEHMEPIFPGVEESVWSYDEVAGAWYHHRFYSHQPDLNTLDPHVQAQIHKIAEFWIELGVSGFRVDAASHLIEPKNGQPPPEDPHEILRELRRVVAVRAGNPVLIGESDVEPGKVADYFGRSDGLQMLFNFVQNNYLFLALARQSGEPLARCLKLLPARPRFCQWANFVRNLDELDLERLSDDERKEVCRVFAPDDRMRIYGRGIRRRVAPMLGGDQRRAAMAFSLNFTLPGSPVIVYGDEIGMGEDLSLEGRNSVRTPMQWTAEPNAGFSSASPDRLIRPVISGGDFGYERVNVAAQAADPRSLLHRIKRMIRQRGVMPEFGWGNPEVLDTGDEAVFAHRCRWKGRDAIAVHNLSDRERAFRLEVAPTGRPVAEPVCDQDYGDAGGSDRRRIGPYGYRWFLVGEERRSALLQ